jgi:NTP pyrophosphatase (non-canonical NTP hydrolase)
MVRFVVSEHTPTLGTFETALRELLEEMLELADWTPEQGRGLDIRRLDDDDLLEVLLGEHVMARIPYTTLQKRAASIAARRH